MNPKPIETPAVRRFGPFEFDASSRELRKNGLRVHIQEQPARILEALLERGGDLISRDELREALWPSDTFVDFERGLNAAVAKLRQVLGDSAEHPRYVETVAKRGYRFAGRIEAPVAAHLVSLPTPPVATAAVKRGWIRSKWVRPALVLAAAAVLFGAWVLWRPRSAGYGGAEVVRFVLPPPEGVKVHTVSAISPDGSRVAFVGMEADGRRALWVRELATENARRLEQTGGAIAPFFSPDSQHIGFFAEGKLKRVAVSGGAPEIVTEQEQGAGGTWNRENVIVFSKRGRLHRVSGAGGPSTELARPLVKAGIVTTETWPQFLPDGRFLVLSRSYSQGQIYPDRSEIVIGSLDSGKRRLLLPSPNRAAFTRSGHLLFLREGNLHSQQLDLDRDRLVGEPSIIAEDLTVTGDEIAVDVNVGMPVWVAAAGFSASDNGVLVYHSNGPLTRQLSWFDREGKRLSVVGEPRAFTQISLSPDEKWAAVGIRIRTTNRTLQDLWLMHLDTQVLSPLSLGDGVDADPVWSPDSSRIMYGVYRPSEGNKISIAEATLGDRKQRMFFADGHVNKPEAWSPDGRDLLYRRNEQIVLALPLLGARTPVPLIETPFFRGRFRFSPDGRWIAYMSGESGKPEVYVSSYPSIQDTRQISRGGGCTAIWRGDGKELFFMTPRGELMSVDVKKGSQLEFGPAKILFHPKVREKDYCLGLYGATADGQRFLVNEIPPLPGLGAKMHVVTRWSPPAQ